jgi:hypothetical protein
LKMVASRDRAASESASDIGLGVEAENFGEFLGGDCKLE